MQDATGGFCGDFSAKELNNVSKFQTTRIREKEESLAITSNVQ